MPITIWLAPTWWARCCSASGVNTIDTITGYLGNTNGNLLDTDPTKVTQDEFITVPGSLLGKAKVAQSVFDNKFLLPFAPDRPEFFLVPGNNQVTVLWARSGTESNPDPFFQVAGQPLINGAPTFLTLADRTPRPHEVVITPAAGWNRSMTALPAASGGAHRYRAPDYDTLVDSPIVAGNPAVYRFEVDGIPHFLVNVGEGGVWDGPRSAADVEKIVHEYRKMWGSLPYRKYVFLKASLH